MSNGRPTARREETREAGWRSVALVTGQSTESNDVAERSRVGGRLVKEVRAIGSDVGVEEDEVAERREDELCVDEGCEGAEELEDEDEDEGEETIGEERVEGEVICREASRGETGERLANMRADTALAFGGAR